MNKYKKLFNNSIVFAIGSLGSKLMVFFLVPIYTYYLNTNEFGLVDLLTTTISLILPLFTMSIAESVLRFVMDKNYNKKTILINSFIVIVLGFILLLLLYPVLVIILPFHDYIFYFYILLFLQSIYSLLAQYIRAEGLVRLYAISGVLNAFILLICNIVLLVLLNMGITGYLYSIILSYLLSSIFITIFGKVYRHINFKKVNIRIMEEMLRYSIPLIPNALMWWIMGLSDRYIITYFLGLGANGLYAVANKIPSILNIVNSIFFQAWQMSAIEEVNSKNKSTFFSNVFNIFSVAMLVSTSLLLLNLKFIIGTLVSEDYFESWKYVPFLLLGIVFSSFSGFLGTNYIAAKRTSGVFKTSIIGAILNILVNLVLIPLIGLNGAALGTMFSFAIIWLLRVKDTKQFVNITINIKKLLLTLIIILIQIWILYIDFGFEYLLGFGCFIIIILVNFYEIKIVSQKMLQVLKSKVKK